MVGRQAAMRCGFVGLMVNPGPPPAEFHQGWGTHLVTQRCSQTLKGSAYEGQTGVRMDEKDLLEWSWKDVRDVSRERAGYRKTPLSKGSLST